ncbi:hypothetical protein J6590_053868 [Homalodisca vitripennis]|nr:hypothetical protein J6590_053868 [Homalodisca vitripennis]
MSDYYVCTVTRKGRFLEAVFIHQSVERAERLGHITKRHDRLTLNSVAAPLRPALVQYEFNLPSVRNRALIYLRFPIHKGAV